MQAKNLDLQVFQLERNFRVMNDGVIMMAGSLEGQSTLGTEVIKSKGKLNLIIAKYKGGL